jgi:dephospho-CoA kinase
VKLFGITGGVGMGKTTAGRLLRQRGVQVADTDEIAHQLTAPGQPALREIAEQFGSFFLSQDGRLDRARLAGAVFADAALRARLEAILHPRIRAAWRAEAEGWRADGKACGAVVIPLLFETEAERGFDAVICVACSESAQRQRLRQRGWTDDQIRQRLAAQWSAEMKMARSDFVVWSDMPQEATAAQLERVVQLATSSAASGAPV